MNGKRLLLWALIGMLLCFPCSALADDPVPQGMIRYDGNGGNSEAFGERIDRRISGTHLRENSLLGASYFKRDGYVLTGWNTAPDGSGTHIGLGSRTAAAEGLTLYAEWAKATDEAQFVFGNGAILAYTGSDRTVVVPEEIGGVPVKTISAGAFSDLALDALVLPSGLEKMEDGAFRGCSVSSLTLFDRLRFVSDAAFSDCAVTALHINAALLPAYCGSYFATFADKYDYLLSIADQQKLVLFSGSSGRYGYDSAALEKAFPAYRVVNMGVYAYTNALPQYEWIRPLLHTGDILLVAPEFDAVPEQFCTTNRLDTGFWAMAESNYDMIVQLDFSQFSGAFDSFAAYQKTRSGMPTRDYSESPFSYDDDGNRYDFATYNRYGDFILPRPNSEHDELHRHNIADYTTETVTADAADALERELQSFSDAGITVLFTYAPRNRSSLTERSTSSARKAVHSLLCAHLSVPVISDLEDSLLSGVYFWQIDNHLSTEGVQLRTKQIIRDLSAALQADGNAPAITNRFRIPIPARPVWIGLFALVLPLVLFGVRKKRRVWLRYGACLLWSAAALIALIGGAALSEVLLCTLPMLLCAAYAGKRGDGA